MKFTYISPERERKEKRQQMIVDIVFGLAAAIFLFGIIGLAGTGTFPY